MTRTWDYDRALGELWQRSSYERGFISDPFGDVVQAERGLARAQALLTGLGNPQIRVPAVHIAGSKGKGSTGVLIAAAAKHAGHRVGLYSSPHLHRFPERIAINGRPISDDTFAASAETVTAAAERLEASDPGIGRVSTFELITAMAFHAFNEGLCDLSVIEVGLGGRYDATNVLVPVVSVITRIDLEHTAVLGSTYGQIAWQKAGILRQGIPSVSAPQVPEAEATIIRAADEVGSPLQIGGRDWNFRGPWNAFDADGPWGTWKNVSLSIPGQHQVENACTALAALHIVDKAGIHVSETAARAGLAGARWPGRFEQLVVNGRDVVFDGAHTPAAAVALVKTWQQSFDVKPATVILGMGADKDPGSFLTELAPLINSLVITRADSPRAADPNAIAEAAAALRIPYEVQPSVALAIDTATAGQSGPILITGSLFVVGEAREAFGLAATDLVWQALNRAGVLPSDPGKFA